MDAPKYRQRGECIICHNTTGIRSTIKGNPGIRLKQSPFIIDAGSGPKTINPDIYFVCKKCFKELCKH